MPYQEWVLTDDGQYDLNAFPQLSESALVMLTSPNNPTGANLPLHVLQQLLDKHPESIFVVDEAYGEFAGTSTIDLIKTHQNLLVLKTFSKGYGLPGVRFGYIVGNPSLIQLLKKHTVPFTINIFTELIIKEFLTNPAFSQAIRQNRERVKNLRDFVHYLLTDLATDDEFTVQPSAANFLMLRFREADLLERVKNLLHEQQVLVAYPQPQCLRLTIGTEVEMNRVTRLIKQSLRSYASELVQSDLPQQQSAVQN